jgi:hypothetical protein
VNSEDELAALSAPATVEKVVILENRDDSAREEPVRA